MMKAARVPNPDGEGGMPKNGMGIAFWIAGVPGRADMVKVEVPSAMAAGGSGGWGYRPREQGLGDQPITKKATNRLTPP